MISIAGNIKNITGDTIRLIHDGESLITAFRGDSKTVTSTIHNVEEFKDPADAYKLVIALGLIYDEQYFVGLYGQDVVDSWKS